MITDLLLKIHRSVDADQRARVAEAVQAWLVEKGAPVERIFMLAPKVAAGKDGARPPGVEFALK